MPELCLIQITCNYAQNYAGIIIASLLHAWPAHVLIALLSIQFPLPYSFCCEGLATGAYSLLLLLTLLILTEV